MSCWILVCSSLAALELQRVLTLPAGLISPQLEISLLDSLQSWAEDVSVRRWFFMVQARN